jgi:hypothetical protein
LSNSTDVSCRWRCIPAGTGPLAQRWPSPGWSWQGGLDQGWPYPAQLWATASQGWTRPVIAHPAQGWHREGAVRATIGPGLAQSWPGWANSHCQPPLGQAWANGLVLVGTFLTLRSKPPDITTDISRSWSDQFSWYIYFCMINHLSWQDENRTSICEMFSPRESKIAMAIKIYLLADRSLRHCWLSRIVLKECSFNMITYFRFL